MFCIMSPIKLGQCIANWYIVSWINLLQNNVNYLVKIDMLIVHVLPMSCYRKKLQNLSHLKCDLQICQI